VEFQLAAEYYPSLKLTSAVGKKAMNIDGGTTYHIGKSTLHTDKYVLFAGEPAKTVAETENEAGASAAALFYIGESKLKKFRQPDCTYVRAKEISKDE
jgi:hypothetical protein